MAALARGLALSGRLGRALTGSRALRAWNPLTANPETRRLVGGLDAVSDRLEVALWHHPGATSRSIAGARTRLQIANLADQAASKHTGESRNRGKGGRPADHDPRTVEGVKMRGFGEERGATRASVQPYIAVFAMLRAGRGDCRSSRGRRHRLCLQLGSRSSPCRSSGERVKGVTGLWPRFGLLTSQRPAFDPKAEREEIRTRKSAACASVDIMATSLWAYCGQ